MKLNTDRFCNWILELFQQWYLGFFPFILSSNNSRFLNFIFIYHCLNITRYSSSQFIVTWSLSILFTFNEVA